MGNYKYVRIDTKTNTKEMGLGAEPIKSSNRLYLCFYHLSAHTCLKWNSLNIAEKWHPQLLTRTPFF